MPSGKTILAGVMGHPVSHSLSPRLHGYWLAHYGIDGMYMPLAVKPDDFETAIRALPKMGFRGINLTIPYKERIIPLLDEVDDDAKAIGAVNTIYITADGLLQGMNTDAYGFIHNIRPHMGGKKKRAVVLGAGGASKAICYGLIKEGFSDIILTNRTQERADALAVQLGRAIRVIPWHDRDHVLTDCDVLVNTTSLGMENQAPLDISLDMLPVDAVVTDIVYAPLQTALLKKAQSRGNVVVDGLGMLLHQAVPGFERWFGITPDVTPELRDHVLKAGV
jgi:shikimate dehydrogenase